MQLEEEATDLSQQCPAAMRPFAICVSTRTVQLLSPPWAPGGRRLGWEGLLLCLYDQGTKEINRKSMFSTFWEPASGVLEFLVLEVCLYFVLEIFLWG